MKRFLPLIVAAFVPLAASAIVTASTPLASDATKVIFDSSAKRNWRGAFSTTRYVPI